MRPIIHEKRSQFLCAINRCPRFLSCKFFKNANAGNVLRFFEFNIRLLEFPGAIRVDQATCITDLVVKTFAEENIIRLLISTMDDHRAPRTVERLIRTLRDRERESERERERERESE